MDKRKFSDTFKEGQDFEFVKYKLSQLLEIYPEQILSSHVLTMHIGFVSQRQNYHSSIFII